MSERRIYSTREVMNILEKRGSSRAERTLQQYYQRNGIGEKIAGRLFFTEEDIQYIILRKGKVGKPKKKKSNKT